jgi:hypothetical protein
VYEIDTTPLPANAALREDWRQRFNSRFPQHHRFPVNHDGNKITVDCNPEDLPECLGEIDAAIKDTNKWVKENLPG